MEEVNDRECHQQVHSSPQPTFKLKLVSSRGFPDGTSSSDKSKATTEGSDLNSEYHKISMQHDEDSTINQHRSSDFPSSSRNFQECTDKSTGLHDTKRLHFESAKMYGAVYKRTKASKHRKNLDSDSYGNGDSTSVSNDDGGYQPPDYSPVTTGTGSLRRSARRSCAYTDDGSARVAISHVKNSSHEASTSGRRIVIDRHEWGSTSKTASLRSSRNKREGCNSPDTHLVEKKRQVSLNCWLMLLEHEDIYRYIPQIGDEVMYLLQGHEEYLNRKRLSDNCPWNRIKGLKAVELCKIQGLSYTTSRGSGESCCKLTLKFFDDTSSGFGEEFTITLLEPVDFPDFLVERTRFEAAIAQKWVIRDKCRVWWADDGEEGGSWWEGRVLAIRPKSTDFPESPWEKYVIRYKNDGSKHLHSPWELHDADNPLVSWKHPHIDSSIRNKLLSAVTNLQKMSHINQDQYGVMKLDTVARKLDFINRFPVQFSIEVISARLHNDYYRTLEAVQHDATVMVANAESYFSKSAEMTKKIRRLSSWVKDYILSV